MNRIFLWTCTMKPGPSPPDVAVMARIAHILDLYYRKNPAEFHQMPENWKAEKVAA